MIRLTRTSIITQRDNTMILPIEGERVTAWLKARRADPQTAPLIQDAFPDLNDEQREFVLTGVTPNEWQEMTRH
tara:strand:+ start:396 stop:617 length:222 start_codon:yes stop_codon:yes gene_type:complete